jgi:hypothetical protein
MYKPSIYLVITYFSTYLPMYMTYIFPTELVTKVKPNINSVEVHPQLSNNGHPVENEKIRVLKILMLWSLYLTFDNEWLWMMSIIVFFFWV